MLALSALDVIEVIALGLLGFLIVAVVCVVILAFLELILPRTDAGAEAVARQQEEERQETGDASDDEVEGPTALDTEDDA